MTLLCRSRILDFARNLSKCHQRRTKQGVRSKRKEKKEEDSPVISKRQLALPGGHRTSGGHGRTRMQPLSPFLSLHLGTSRTSAGAVLDQSLVRISVTEPTYTSSAQRFKGLLLREEGRKGLEWIRDWAACRRLGFPPQSSEGWHVMTKCG